MVFKGKRIELRVAELLLSGDCNLRLEHVKSMKKSNRQLRDACFKISRGYKKKIYPSQFLQYANKNWRVIVSHFHDCKILTISVNTDLKSPADSSSSAAEYTMDSKKDGQFDNTLSSAAKEDDRMSFSFPEWENSETTPPHLMIESESPKKIDNSKSTSFTSTSSSDSPEYLINKIISNSYRQQDISSEVENISIAASDSAKPPQSVSPLPKNSKNDPSTEWKKPAGYRVCTILEGEFNLTENEMKTVFDGRKLIIGSYDFLIKSKFKNVNNTCILVIKTKRINKNGIIIYGECSHRDCKLFKIIVDSLAKFSAANCTIKGRVYSTSINYHHLQLMTAQVRGVERKMYRKKLHAMKPIEFQDQCIRDIDPAMKCRGNAGNYKSDATVRKIRSEQLALNDRHKDDLYDIIEAQKAHPEYIQCAGSPFFVYITSSEQLELLLRELKIHPLLLLHLDATGSVIRRPSDTTKTVYYYSGVIQLSSNRVVPVLEMVSSSHYAVSIGQWLGHFKGFCLRTIRKWPVFSFVVVDFSFAFLNAIAEYWNNTTVLKYLHAMYEYIVCENKSNTTDDFIKIYICNTHFFKVICDDINANFTDYETAKQMKEIMAAAMNFSDMKTIMSWFRNLNIILNSKYNTLNVETAFKNLLQICCSLSASSQDKDESNADFNNVHVVPFSDNKPKSLYKESPFYRLFKKIGDDIPLNDNDHTEDANRYYCPTFYDLILKKYLPLLPFWAAKLSYHKRVNNQPVERYFGIVKNSLMKGEMHQKCSRVLRRIRRHVIARHKEYVLNIKQVRLAVKASKKTVSDNGDIETGPLSQETWKKSIKGSAISHFKGASIKKSLELFSSSSQQQQFISSAASLAKKCLSFLSELNSIEKEKVEQSTREQRNSPEWTYERSRRLTASNFGKVCRAKDDVTLGKLAYNILYPVTLSKLPAIRYGIINESRAIKLYERKTGTSVKPCGLVVYNENSFLGCSPDALVNDDGVVEVKCPFKITDLDPEEATKAGKVDFLNRNGSIKQNNIYHYQIQGQLHITDRNWCDLVIFTLKDIYIVRVERDREFWKNMLPKLTDFYLYFLLPQLCDPITGSDKVLLHRRIWSPPQDMEENAEIKLTEATPKVMPNGLFVDVKYYVPLHYDNRDKDYVVGLFNMVIPQLYYSDFKTLDDGTWVSNFIIDTVFDIIKKEKNAIDFEVIPCEKSFYIFNNSNVNVPLNYTKQAVFPVLIEGNHWCLAIADFQEKKFVWLNPIRNRVSEMKRYLDRFTNFLKNHHPRYADKWLIHIMPHTNQTNSTDCGIYIIYFYEQLLSEKDLTDEFDIPEFRHRMKKEILTHSASVAKMCYLCGLNVEFSQPYSKCLECRRLFHNACLTTSEYDFLCLLCTKYASMKIGK